MSIFEDVDRIKQKIGELQDELILAEKSHAEAVDMLCDCAGQFLMSNDAGTVYHSYMSTEEALCAYLVRVGKLIPGKPGEFRWAASGASACVPGEASMKACP